MCECEEQQRLSSTHPHNTLPRSRKSPAVIVGSLHSLLVHLDASASTDVGWYVAGEVIAMV